MSDQLSSSPRPRSRGPFLPLALLLAFGALLLAGRLRPHPQPAAALPQVARTNLVRRDGRWFAIGRTNPFTGVLLEYYPGGTLESRSAVSNGWLEGLSEGWHTNGQLEVRESFRTNVSNGLRTKWYPSGHRLSEATIVLGKMEEVFRRWHENGTLAEEIPMRAGKIEGVGRAYYEDGSLQTELTMHDSQVVGTKSWPKGPLAGGKP